jgi:hypothetical protein
VLGKLVSTCRRMKLYFFCQLIIVNWKWIKDLNVQASPVNLLTENIVEKHNIDLGNDIWMWFQSTGNKSKNRQVGLHKTKKLSKESVSKMKTQPTEWNVLHKHVQPTQRQVLCIWNLKTFFVHSRVGWWLPGFGWMGGSVGEMLFKWYKIS